MFFNKINGAIKCYKEHGCIYTLNEIFQYIQSLLYKHRECNKTVSVHNHGVSIIMPVYNAAQYLEQSISSILEQSFSDFELICVDGGSKDNSCSILETFSRQDSRVKIINQSTHGLGFARNIGLEAAQKEYIVFLDSDDFFDKGLLYKSYSVAIENNVDIVVYLGDIYDEYTGCFMQANGMLNKQMLPNKDCFSKYDFPKYVLNFTYPNVWTKLYRKNFLIDNALFFSPLRIAEDVPHTFSALAMADKISLVRDDRPLVHCRRGIDTNMSSNKDEFVMLFQDSYSLLQARLIVSGCYDELKQSFVNRALEGAIYEIESTKSEKYKEMAKLYFVKEMIYQFDIADKAQDYFYKKNNYDLLQQYIVSVNEEQRKLKENFDIDVSVIVPVYNAEEYLCRCIDSLITQTFHNVEFIFIDDGSTDASLNILKQYQSVDERIKIFQQDNLHAGVARNVGMLHAQGKYIIFLDADDFFESNLLEKLFIEAEKSEADIVVCNADRYDHITEEFLGMSWLLKEKYLPEKQVFNRNDIPDYIFIFTLGVPWNKLFKRGFLEKQHIMFQNNKRGNDAYFVYSAIAVADRISVVNEILIHYRVNTGKNLQSGNDKNPTDFLRALMGIQHRLFRLGEYSEIERSFVNLAMDNCMYTLSSIDKTSEAYCILSEQLRFFYLNEFGILDKDYDYFYDKRYCQMLKKFLEEEYNNQ